MTNDERYIMEALSNHTLDEDEQQFIEYHLFTSHQSLTQEQHDKVIAMYDKYIGLGMEGTETDVK